MRKYQGATARDRPQGGGSYNKDRKGNESLNFAKHGGMYYGFVRPGRGHRINVRRLGGDGEKAENVLVVFCAPRPNARTTLVVGWYDDATVFREPQPRTWGEGIYNIVSRKATLLTEAKRTFIVPRAQRDGYGLGQANVYYPELGRDGKWLPALLAHVESPDASPGRKKKRSRGGGRRRKVDAEMRAQIESMAVAYAWRRYEGLGYLLRSVENDNVGWDLECDRGDIRKLVEVKGLQGKTPIVELTPNEWAKMKHHAEEYELCIVSRALTGNPDIHIGRLAREGKRYFIELEDGARLLVKEATAARISP